MAVTDGRGKRVTRQRRSVMLGDVNSVNIVGNHDHNLMNGLRAVKERVFKVKRDGVLADPPAPADGSFIVVDQFMRRVADAVGPRHPLTTEQFVAQCAKGKRRLYEAASVALAREGVSFRDTRVRAFVKNEKIMFAESGDKSDPAPRVIQPRSPKYNVALGRYTRAIEHDVYSAIAKVCATTDDSQVVMKGVDPVQAGNAIRAKWDQFDHPVAVGIDASRFDQHVSVRALQSEHSCYNAIFGSKELEWLLRQQLVTNGVMYCDDKRLLYRREGGRCSGDMNTGLGNCLLMCGLVDGFVAGRFRYQLVNNGDDCVIIMERRCLNRLEGIERYFLDHGFTIKMEDDDHVKQYGETTVGFVSKFERLTFCQMRPVRVADGWIMVRCPNASFAKDSMALCQTVEWRKWIRAVGDGGVALYGDIPICSALYENYQRNGTSSGNIKDSLLYQDTGFSRMCRVRRCGKVEVSDDTRNSYARAFGIPPSQQKRIERFLRNLVLHDPSGVRYGPQRGNPLLSEHQYH